MAVAAVMAGVVVGRRRLVPWVMAVILPVRRSSGETCPIADAI